MKIFANSNCLILFVLLFCGLNLFGQRNVAFDKSNFPDRKDELKAAEKALKEGDKIMSYGNENLYNDAIPFYELAHDFNPDNADLNFRLGVCYVNSLNKRRSLRYFEKARDLDPHVDPYLNFFLARGYHFNAQWDKAIEHYKLHREFLRSEGLHDEREEVIRYIEQCGNGKQLIAEPERVWIDNLGPNINSEYHDYALVINADETRLIFTSRRPSTTGGQIDPDLNDYFEDVYISQRFGDEWGQAENLGGDFNTDTHDASVSMSADGQTMFIFRFSNRTRGDIYVSFLTSDGYWSEPEKLSKPVNSDAHESSASLSPDNKTLYFVSDREGGLGGRDIYYCRRDDRKGKWGDAINLGPVINTRYNEEGVFIHPDGKTLYFSSEGHNSMGGVDIFYSTLQDGQWSNPRNIGHPINTPEHDVFFVPAANTRYAYFTSVREGGFGGRDNYRITFLGELKPPVLNAEDNLIASLSQPIQEIVVEPEVEIRTSAMAILKGLILDEITGDPVNAQIELTDNSTSELMAAFQSEPSNGKYLVTLPSGKNYGIAIKADGYLFHSEHFNLPADAQFKTYVKNIQLKRIEVGKSVVLRNIFFDTNKYELRPESMAELSRLESILVENPQIRMEISGHTDSDGSAELNQKLSENRAKSVVEYLVERGIDRSRLTYMGYGATAPVASNETPEGKQENRRTEFKIIE